MGKVSGFFLSGWAAVFVLELVPISQFSPKYPGQQRYCVSVICLYVVTSLGRSLILQGTQHCYSESRDSRGTRRTSPRAAVPGLHSAVHLIMMICVMGTAGSRRLSGGRVLLLVLLRLGVRPLVVARPWNHLRERLRAVLHLACYRSRDLMRAEVPAYQSDQLFRAREDHPLSLKSFASIIGFPSNARPGNVNATPPQP